MTKGGHIKNLVKSKPPFDVQRQYLWKFLTDLQSEGSFEVSLSNFSLFFLFSQNLARLSLGLIFHKLSSGD